MLNATLTPPMPVKEQAKGPVRGNGLDAPATIPAPTISRAANGGTPGKRPVLGPATHQPFSY